MQISSEGVGQKRAGWFLHTGLLPDRIRLAKAWQAARTKSDPVWFCPIISGKPESKSRELAAGWLRPARNRARWFLHTSLLLDQMRLAKPWPGHPDVIRVGFARHDPCLLWKNGAETDAGSRIRHILSGPILAARWPKWPSLAVTKTLPARFWLHAGRNGHHWPLPKRFQPDSGCTLAEMAFTGRYQNGSGIGSGMFTGLI